MKSGSRRRGRNGRRSGTRLCAAGWVRAAWSGGCRGRRRLGAVDGGRGGVARRGARRVGVRALGAAHGGVCVTRRPGLAAQRLPRLFAAPVRAGFEHMRRGHGFACNSIFLRLRMAVMESVRHAMMGVRAAGGRTMKRRGARETLSFGVAWPRPCRQGPGGHSRAGAATVGGTPRYRKRPVDTPWHRAPKRGGGRLAGVKGGPGGARRVRRGGPETIKREKTTDCGETRVPRDGSGRCPLTRDNCCYRESNCQFSVSARQPGTRPDYAPAIPGSTIP